MDKFLSLSFTPHLVPWQIAFCRELPWNYGCRSIAKTGNTSPCHVLNSFHTKLFSCWVPSLYLKFTLTINHYKLLNQCFIEWRKSLVWKKSKHEKHKCWLDLSEFQPKIFDKICLLPLPYDLTPQPPPKPTYLWRWIKTVAEPILQLRKVNQKQTITNCKISGIHVREIALNSCLAHSLSDARFPYVIRLLIAVKIVNNKRRRGPASRPTASSTTHFCADDLQHDQFASAIFVGQGNDGFLVVA